MNTVSTIIGIVVFAILIVLLFKLAKSVIKTLIIASLFVAMIRIAFSTGILQNIYNLITR